MSFARLPVMVFCLSNIIIGVLGHMQLSSPPPLRSRFNPYSGSDIDYSMTSPLRSDGIDFPCKGYQQLLTTTKGTPVGTLEGGKKYSMIVTGEAVHAGGSCQASLSVDGGHTFRVLHSYIGGCPAAPGDNSFTFRVPADVPTKERALFAWTWFNNLGNREMYMNCVSINTKTGAGSEGTSGFLSRPLVFKANVGNGCTTKDSTDVMIPNPGPDVTVNNPDAVPPVGSCEAGPGAPAPGSPGPSSKPGPGAGSGGCSATPVKSSSDNHETSRPYSRDFTPGNDWPAGYQGVGSNLRGSTIVMIGVAHLVAFVIGVWLWL
ncbi:hypothetical protein G7Z17_g7940 [Cylindrodendrum hubeiense]|uniref:Extracellular protein n=1 Tax=Cylindrodendrum hubeiense TaxID=595255 RepID=A0A9P5H9K3_9HYPO|nr:hypothetical protein G7Z17_g7940 [Cylindrodendrum hubeiense]